MDSIIKLAGACKFIHSRAHCADSHHPPLCPLHSPSSFTLIVAAPELLPEPSCSQSLPFRKLWKRKCEWERDGVNPVQGGGGIVLGRKNEKANEKIYWVCSNCGYTTGQWWGVCGSCSVSGTMKEFHEATSDADSKGQWVCDFGRMVWGHGFHSMKESCAT
ncbi:hypothetical protein SESBI_07871 [Sesbania bispinosa]|nr:hypothetical protein SESBI_07871 [Sesbania bispinosa]